MITTGTSKTDYQNALDTFFSQLTTELFYLNYAKSFYIYILSSQSFRKIFVERIIQIYCWLYPCRKNNVRRPQRNLNGRTNNILHIAHIQGSTGNR